jgi:hypothetical protein
VLDLQGDPRASLGQTTSETLAVAAASISLHISPIPYGFGPTRPPFIDGFRRSSFAYDVGILESLLAYDSLSPTQRKETAELARSLRFQDAQPIAAQLRDPRFPLKLQVGQPFWKGEELGVVVGWASLEGCELLGRYFEKLAVASGRFELTPELEAKYPEG